jgi:hypothetical protein
MPHAPGSRRALTGLVGFDAADRLGGGPPEGPGVLAVQVDGDGAGCDAGGDDLPGVAWASPSIQDLPVRTLSL